MGVLSLAYFLAYAGSVYLGFRALRRRPYNAFRTANLAIRVQVCLSTCSPGVGRAQSGNARDALGPILAFTVGHGFPILQFTNGPGFPVRHGAVASHMGDCRQIPVDRFLCASKPAPPCAPATAGEQEIHALL
jgi:hypothetical protein